MEFFHNPQTCQSKITQCKYPWVILQAAFISNLPHSKSMKRQDLQAHAEKLLKCDWHVKEMVSKVLHDLVLKHSGINQSYGSCVPQRYSLDWVIYFISFISPSDFITTFLLSPSSIQPPVCIIGCKLLLWLPFKKQEVLVWLLWSNTGVTSLSFAWVSQGDLALTQLCSNTGYLLGEEDGAANRQSC